MKKYVNRLLLLLFVCTILVLNIREDLSYAMPNLEAEGVMLMDAITGKVLFEKNSNTKFEPASTTKVMTALIVLENSNIDDKVTIGYDPQMVDGSAIGIREGEVYTIEELLLGLLLESGNDCAEALAEYITNLTVSTGANAEFGKIMTKRAQELGAHNTTFKNPSGLSEEGHITTANDLALIMKEAFKNEDFIRISRTESYFFKDHPFSDGTEKWATNRNNCLMDWYPYYYENLYTGKTGYTPEANHTYTAVAKKEDQYLVAAFLNAVDKNAQYYSVSDLFNWGFENFNTEKIISSGDNLGSVTIDDTTISLLATKDVYYTFEANSNTDVNKSVTFEKRDLSETTIKKGDILFNSKLFINGEEYGTMELASSADREYIPPTKMEETIETLSSYKTVIIATVIIILILLVIFISRIKTRNIRKRRAMIRRKHNF